MISSGQQRDSAILMHVTILPQRDSSVVALLVKNLPAVQGTQVKSLGHEDSLEKRVQTTPVFLPGKSYGQRRLVGYSLCDRKSRTQLKRLNHHILPQTPLPSRLSHNIEQSSMCYSRFLFHFKYSSVYMSVLN